MGQHNKRKHVKQQSHKKNHWFDVTLQREGDMVMVTSATLVTLGVANSRKVDQVV